MKKNFMILLLFILSFAGVAEEVGTHSNRLPSGERASGVEGRIQEEGWQVVRRFENAVKYNNGVDIRYYGKLPEDLNYVIVMSSRINLRSRPTTKSEIVGKAGQSKRMTVLEEILNDEGEKWYRVLSEEGEVFVFSKIVALREFRFQEKYDKVIELEGFIEGNLSEGREVASVNAYIPNPDNKDFQRKKDKYGNVQDQSALGYYEGTRVFIPDRTIVAVESRTGNRSRVVKQGGEEPYLDISNSRISRNPSITEMPGKVIVIDVKNQNFVVYEKGEGSWDVISYAYSKTGLISKLGFKTPKGSFIVPVAKREMVYNNSLGEKQGTAKYAIRFSGGGYIHGTPFDLEEEEELERYKKLKESTLGSYPGTRKCVRNDLEHAKFLFDWVVGGELQKGNNQKLKENVAVIVM